MNKRMAALVVLLANACSPTPRPQVSIQVSYSEAGGCHLRIGNREVPFAPSNQIGAIARDKRTAVHVVGDAQVPYKCIGGVIYKLQQAGFYKSALSPSRHPLARPPPG